VFKFKKRKNYNKLRGHRQQLTRVKIDSVGSAKAE
ncbi:MAG: 50S ribosomal protein L21, partial [Eggerthellaceae bacterium]|nr:50S ribosomal protein L21 [Eggerthellaceae bacterium]